MQPFVTTQTTTMDDNLTVKLKSLKVVDLKAILAQANVQVPAKANKNDLIARIIGSTKAVDVYNKLHSPQDDLLAPPEECVALLSHHLA